MSLGRLLVSHVGMRVFVYLERMLDPYVNSPPTPIFISRRKIEKIPALEDDKKYLSIRDYNAIKIRCDYDRCISRKCTATLHQTQNCFSAQDKTRSKIPGLPQ